MNPPRPSESVSEPASARRRRQPVSLKRAKKLDPASHQSLQRDQSSESEESSLESRAIQSMPSRRPRLKNQSLNVKPCRCFGVVAGEVERAQPTGRTSIRESRQH